MRILAIELGGRSIKAVELESRFRKFEVLDFHEIKLPLKIADLVDLHKEAIKEIFAKLPSHPDKIVVSLPAPSISMRFLTIPIKQKKKVEQMFRFELEDSLPFKLDDTVVEREIFSQRDSSLVFAAIAPNKFITNYLDYLQKIGIDPDWLTFDGMGLINLFVASRNSEVVSTNSGPVLLLDLGHNKTNLSIINEGRLEAFRNFGWGGFSITQNIALTSGLPLEHAELELDKLNLEQKNGPNELDEITGAAIQALSPLITELNHSYIAYRNQTKQSITAIYISGGTSRIRGLSAFLSKQLGGVPCQQFNPAEFFPLREELKSSQQGEIFAEAWGRGNVYSRRSPLMFNFRKSGFGKQTSLNEISEFFKNPGVVKLGQYALILVLMLFVHVSASTYIAEQENGKANEELKKVFQDTFKNAPKALKGVLLENPDKLKDYINQKNQEMDQKLKMVSKSRESVISVLKSITSSFPTGVKVDVNKLKIEDRNLLLEGVLYEGEINLVTEALKKLPIISDVTFTTDGPRFTYKAKISGR